MENYIVSARKYRPSTFESVVGQKALTTTLKNAIATHKLAHAYLFCGPRGVGKTTCARIFAKTINCMTPTADGEACNTCESCVAFNEQRSYNIHELDAASNNSVDDIRQLVDQVRIPPQIGKYKVYIIDEVHMLSASAFNAFLKTLEEPPHHAIFILATTEKHKIIPTILSRCQIYDFNRISVEDTVSHLMYVAQKESVTAEPEALNVIALKADGGMRDALSIFDQVVSFTGGKITYQSAIENLNVLDYEYYFRLTDFLLENNVMESMLLFNDVLNNGFEGSHFVTGLSSHFRDLLVSKDPVTLPLLEVGASIRDRYQVQAQKCPLPFIYKAIKLCNDCDMNYRTSKNKRLLVELTLIQVAQLTAEGEDVSHGRRPTELIKPIFKPAAAQQPQATASTQQPVATEKPQSVTATPQPAHKMPDILKSTKTTTEKKIPVISASQISIRQAKKNTAPEQIMQTTQAVIPSEPEKDYPIDEVNLNLHWQAFASELPQDDKALADRMKHAHIKLIDDVSFEFVLENDFVKNLFVPLKPAIESYLRKHLRNKQITLYFRISTTEDKKKVLSRGERFQQMAIINDALIDLKNEFGLELY
ncbi:DNA polymerase III subunit gamma/tau [Bacteroides sp. 214]|uniref:DNA polymerase III subunit gamma/tau n=1 Tax=Bacteroides sp. 214 TaxID=2302935 RepID=UPI0013D36767|nr:DNA polymerase III subunit gamma/tau [Bacteroides sp. 214]NDW11649.1 DNA polymerase III subunit gamma/tau [Bacteroides sp. 214]